MSVNLLQLAHGALSGPIVDQLSGSLGVRHDEAQSIIDAALPAILGGLIKNAATPSGVDELFVQVQQHGTAVGDHQGDLLGGMGQEESLTAGLAMAQRLLGNQFDAIREVLGRAAQLSDDVASQGLSLLVPVVIRVLHQQTSQLGLDAPGLANLLRQQSDPVQAALPPELRPILALDAAQTAAVDTKPDSPQRVAATTGRLAEGAGGGSRETAIGKLLPLIGLLALALLAWMFIKGGVEKAQRLPDAPDAVSDDVLDPNIELPVAAEVSVETGEDLSVDLDHEAP